jgi:trehalose 6-phosphate synthase/phosphatase
MPAGTLVVAMGNDGTDEDLFAALPFLAVAVHVGAGQRCAPIRSASIGDARRLLAQLLEAPPVDSVS